MIKGNLTGPAPSENNMRRLLRGLEGAEDARALRAHPHGEREA